MTQLQNMNALFTVIGLAVSVLIGTYYLLFNEHLWITAASHAYALIGFVLADFVFISFLVGNKIKLGFVGAVVLAGVQAAVMIVDVYSYQDIPFFKVAGSNFEDMLEHTYGTWSFNVLLVSQFSIIITSVMGLRHVNADRRPTRKQALVIPVILVAIATLLTVFPLSPIYEKENWVYVHGVGWQAPETFRNKDFPLVDKFLPTNGTMVLRQTHPLYVEGTIYMKIPCTEDAKPLLTAYAGTRIYLNVLKIDYIRNDSDPPIYCVYNARFPQGDYVVNFIGVGNTSGEPIFFSEDHKISVRFTRIEGQIPAHPNFDQGQ
ncbi:MAG: hypothetical protein QXN83_10340 [Nitrososphaerales archaeon]